MMKINLTPRELELVYEAVTKAFNTASDSRLPQANEWSQLVGKLDDARSEMRHENGRGKS